MQLFVSDPYVRAHQAVAQLDAAHATLETLDVIEQLQALDDHGGAAAQLRGAVRTLFLATDAQHGLLWRAVHVVVPAGSAARKTKQQLRNSSVCRPAAIRVVCP